MDRRRPSSSCMRPPDTGRPRLRNNGRSLAILGAYGMPPTRLRATTLSCAAT
jgi:hypothetical protein